MSATVERLFPGACDVEVVVRDKVWKMKLDGESYYVHKDKSSRVGIINEACHTRFPDKFPKPGMPIAEADGWFYSSTEDLAPKGYKTAREYLKSASPLDQRFYGYLLGETLADMRDEGGFNHGDAHPDNILVKVKVEDGDEWLSDLMFIDLETAQINGVPRSSRLLDTLYSRVTRTPGLSAIVGETPEFIDKQLLEKADADAWYDIVRALGDLEYREIDTLVGVDIQMMPIIFEVLKKEFKKVAEEGDYHEKFFALYAVSLMLVRGLTGKVEKEDVVDALQKKIELASKQRVVGL
jgi:hypothetical protein